MRCLQWAHGFDIKFGLFAWEPGMGSRRDMRAATPLLANIYKDLAAQVPPDTLSGTVCLAPAPAPVFHNSRLASWNPGHKACTWKSGSLMCDAPAGQRLQGPGCPGADLRHLIMCQ